MQKYILAKKKIAFFFFPFIIFYHFLKIYYIQFNSSSQT
jgi:hypothetical protein